MDKVIEYLNENGWLIIIGFMALVFGIIILAIIKQGNHIKKLKETTLPRRFKYLDTFYYIDSDGEDTETVAFNIIKDNSDDRVYAMLVNSFEHCFFVEYNNPRLVTGKKGLVSNMPKVEFNMEGNVWIEKEMPFCTIEGGLAKIHLEYAFVKTDVKLVVDENQIEKTFDKYNPKLLHINESYDYSILENAILINGIAQFDNYYDN